MPTAEKWIRVGFLLALGLAITAGPASAQGLRHALLVGVGDYIHKTVNDLDGPPHDVHSLEKVLRDDWGFDRVTSLVDHEATRAAILRALDDLIRKTRPDDHVFIYFSGHGTSSYQDRDTGRAQSILTATLDPGTGGLLPADIDLKSSSAGDVLLVGRRDLRPRLQQLDQKSNVFVVFDACYSGNTVKRLPPAPALKYQPWPTTATATPDSGAHAVDERYPYDNLVYMSASAEDERAGDISQEILKDWPTFDGRPHGLLTNAMLRGLAGSADTDDNGELTVRELHGYVRRSLEGQQQPQLLRPPSRGDALDEPVFGAVRSPSRVGRASGSFWRKLLRVRLGTRAVTLRDRVAAIDGVSVTTGAYDLHVDAGNDAAFAVRDGRGDTLASALDAEETLRRVARRAAVQELLRESFPEQSFNVELDILDVAEKDGRRRVTARTNAELFVGDTYEMRYVADVPAYFLLVAVDARGFMRVLVPWTTQDMFPTREGRIPDISVSHPTGTEFLKLFAFRERPAGLDGWLPGRGADGRPQARSIDSKDELDALLRFVRQQAGAAETVRTLTTAAPTR